MNHHNNNNDDSTNTNNTNNTNNNNNTLLIKRRSSSLITTPTAASPSQPIAMKINHQQQQQHSQQQSLPRKSVSFLTHQPPPMMRYSNSAGVHYFHHDYHDDDHHDHHDYNDDDDDGTLTPIKREHVHDSRTQHNNNNNNNNNNNHTTSANNSNSKNNKIFVYYLGENEGAADSSPPMTQYDNQASPNAHQQQQQQQQLPYFYGSGDSSSSSPLVIGRSIDDFGVTAASAMGQKSTTLLMNNSDSSIGSGSGGDSSSNIGGDLVMFPRRLSGNGSSRLRQRVSPPSNLNLRDLSASAPNTSPLHRFSPTSDHESRMYRASGYDDDDDDAAYDDDEDGGGVGGQYGYYRGTRSGSMTSSNRSSIKWYTGGENGMPMYRRGRGNTDAMIRECQTPNPKTLHSSKSASNLLYTPQPQPNYHRNFGKSPINEYFFDLVSSDLIIMEQKKRRNSTAHEDTSSEEDSDDEDVVLLDARSNPQLSLPAFKERSQTMGGGKLMQARHLPPLSFTSKQDSFTSYDLDSPRKHKAYSLDLRGGNNDWFTQKMTTIKQQTDQDLRMYISELNEIVLSKFHGTLDSPAEVSPKDDIEKLLRDHIRVLKTIAQNIIECSVQQLKDGEHKQIVKHLQKLNSSLLGQERKLKDHSSSNLEARRLVNKECSKLVRKLIFIFSRCSRLLEYLRVHENSTTGVSKREMDEIVPKKRNRIQSLMVPKQKTHDLDLRLHRIPDAIKDLDVNVTTPTKPVPSDRLDLGLPKIEPVSPADSLTDSILTPISPVTPILPKDTKSDGFLSKIISKWKNLISSKPEKKPDLLDVEIDSPSKSPTKSGPKTIELLCRICEELVRSDEIETHSKTCALRHDIDMRSVTCDDRLKKLVKSIQKKIQQSNSESSKTNCLTGEEASTLSAFSKVAYKAACLKYTAENTLALQTLINDLGLVQANHQKCVLEQSRGGEVTPPRRSRSSGNELTLGMFFKRIEEVMKLKLKTMQDRNQLSPNVRVHRVSITDFEILKPISKGAFGHVFLAKKKKTGDVYAIKVLKKRDMIRKNKTKNVIAERNVMATVATNDFFVRFYYSFSGKEYLYIVMEYCPGGDLFSLLRAKEQFECDMIRQYAAEIVLALEHLHVNGIVHRDLKPDNILIGQDGHIKLTDFGLSEFGLIDRDPFSEIDDFDVNMGSSSPSSLSTSPARASNMEESHLGDGNSALATQGTPDYLAPELLLGNEHSYPVDYWALGCIIYEFLYGVPPFNDKSPSLIFDHILSMDIEWPDLGDPEDDDDEMRDIRLCSDLAKKLLSPDPSKRLDAKGVKAHEFFAGMEWDKVLTQEPPFIPTPKTEEDTQYFNARMPMYPVSEDESAALMNDSISTVSPSNDGMKPTMVGISRRGSVMSNGSDRGDATQSGSFDEMLSPSMSSSMDFSFGNVQHSENLAHRTKQEYQNITRRKNSLSLADRQSEQQGGRADTSPMTNK